ncbi:MULTISPECIES: DUF2252 family protein [Cupriavidus]|uniref:DUF2252 family protein n=1 Tax=Cupriavidus sp. DF5525 TaxID=3160989 RepID=UPI0032DE2DF0
MASLDRDISSYERWLRKQCSVIESDLQAKHERMRRSPFDFLRATYFRWARTIGSTCPGCTDAPKVVCVGDIHVENFGTWRDAQARLVWGVNDFDEAAAMPYAYDLVRLATSADLAPTLRVSAGDAASAILEGYLKGLDKPHPMLLDEREHWLRPLVAGSQDASRKFWKEVDDYPDASPPTPVRHALRNSLPKGAKIERYASRTKGGGSLGRPRFLVIARWQGGRLVQEAKALVPSAWLWAHSKSPARSRVLDLAFGAHRSPDPKLRIKSGYVLRRIAPDAHKVELEDVAEQGLGTKLLEAMGTELGAIHAAGKRRKRILEDVSKRDPRWLHELAADAVRFVQSDFETLKAL